MNRAQFLKSARIVLALGLAAAMGTLAVVSTRSYIASQLALESQRLRPSVELVDVLVAKVELNAGQSVSERTVAIRKYPSEFVPARVLTPDRFASLNGRKIKESLNAGEPLTEASFDQVPTSAFSGQLRAGVRALTIAVDEINSLSGLLQPGDRIDLQLSVRPPVAQGQSPGAEITAPLMQDVVILATGRQSRASIEDAPTRGFSTITIEVTPEQAQRLIVAQRNGRITALLRSRDDHQQTTQAGLDLPALLGYTARPMARQTASGPEIIVGGKGPIRPDGYSQQNGTATLSPYLPASQLGPITPATGATNARNP